MSHRLLLRSQRLQSRPKRRQQRRGSSVLLELCLRNSAPRSTSPRRQKKPAAATASTLPPVTAPTLPIDEEEDETSSPAPAAASPAASAFTPTKATREGTERLLKELQSIMKAPEYKMCGYEIETADDNIYKWLIRLRFSEGQIVEDLKLFQAALGKDHVLLEVLFPSDFPASPPFMRICYPRFHQYTGHITIGGSICIQELTHSGWNPTFELQTFLVMIRNLLVEGGALIDMDNLSVYSEPEARAAFQRVARQHGWKP